MRSITPGRSRLGGPSTRPTCMSTTMIASTPGSSLPSGACVPRARGPLLLPGRTHHPVARSGQHLVAEPAFHAGRPTLRVAFRDRAAAAGGFHEIGTGQHFGLAFG